METLLELEGVHAYYGLSHVLHGVSLTLHRGEVVALLGRNGAGKTTTMKASFGLVRVGAGRVRYRGKDITGWQPYQIAQLGMALVPEDRRIFPQLTVRENLEVATKRGLSGQAWTVARIYDLFSELRRLDKRFGIWLSGGEQQMLAIARALMGNPEVLLLDEPSEGLAPTVVNRLRQMVLALKQEGLTILVSEQNLRFLQGLVDRVFMLDRGQMVFQGESADFWQNEDLKARYLAV